MTDKSYIQLVEEAIDNRSNLVKHWKLRIVDYNTFNNQIIVQVFYEDDIRGSFFIEAEDAASINYWKAMIGEKKDGNNSSNS